MGCQKILIVEIPLCNDCATLFFLELRGYLLLHLVLKQFFSPLKASLQDLKE